jgi:hypothetical protein
MNFYAVRPFGLPEMPVRADEGILVSLVPDINLVRASQSTQTVKPTSDGHLNQRVVSLDYGLLLTRFVYFLRNKNEYQAYGG